MRGNKEEDPADDGMGGSQSSSHYDTIEESTMTDGAGDNTEDSLVKTPPLLSSPEPQQQVPQQTQGQQGVSPGTLVVQYSTAAISKARGKSRELSNGNADVHDDISNHVDSGGRGGGVDSLPVGMEVETDHETPALEVGHSPTAAVEAEERVRAVTIDKEQQLALLERVVTLTEGKNLQFLQKVHSMLAHLVFRHRLAEDRSQLLKVGRSCDYHFLSCSSHMISTSCPIWLEVT